MTFFPYYTKDLDREIVFGFQDRMKCEEAAKTFGSVCASWQLAHDLKWNLQEARPDPKTLREEYGKWLDIPGNLDKVIKTIPKPNMTAAEVHKLFRDESDPVVTADVVREAFKMTLDHVYAFSYDSDQRKIVKSMGNASDDLLNAIAERITLVLGSQK